MKKVEFRYSKRKNGFYFMMKNEESKEYEYHFVDEEKMFYIMKNKKEFCSGGSVVGESGSFGRGSSAGNFGRESSDDEVVREILRRYKLDRKLVEHAKSITCHRKGIKFNTIRLEPKKVRRVGVGVGSGKKNEEKTKYNSEEIERAKINREAGIRRCVFEWFKDGEVVLRKARGISGDKVSDKVLWEEFKKMIVEKQ